MINEIEDDAYHIMSYYNTWERDFFLFLTDTEISSEAIKIALDDANLYYKFDVATCWSEDPSKDQIEKMVKVRGANKRFEIKKEDLSLDKITQIVVLWSAESSKFLEIIKIARSKKIPILIRLLQKDKPKTIAEKLEESDKKFTTALEDIKAKTSTIC